jgi:hypothetical protein
MAEQARRAPGPAAPRKLVMSAPVQRWLRELGSEQQRRVRAALELVRERGPTLGRPQVDVIHGSRVARLKEVRVDRGTRVLFAFDSNRDMVALVGGDKSGKWDRWYPLNVKHAERLYGEHERRNGRNGREPPCQGPATSPRKPPPRTPPEMGR